MSPATFENLLSLQGHDTALDRLRHRRETLPERAARTEREAALSAVRQALAEVTTRRDTVLREERKLGDEVRSLRDRAGAEDRRMYSGTISSPKELQAIGAEVESLKRRAAEIEDREFEVLEQRETLDAEVSAREAEEAAIVAEVEALTARLSDGERAIDADAVVEEEGRAALLPTLPDGLVALYEKVRRANRGTGAARLVGAGCGACHLSLPATEVDRLRHLPPDEVACCEHCGAILVRSSDAPA